MVGASYSAGSTTFTSCAVSGINVLGLYIGAGGYIGLGNGTTTFDNCSITNSSLEMLNKFDDNGGQARTGAFVGCVTGPNVTVNFQNSTNVESITIIYPFAENSGIKPVYSGLIGSLQNYDDIDFTVNGTIPGTVDGISFRYTS